jgi:GAF domain-containing protein
MTPIPSLARSEKRLRFLDGLAQATRALSQPADVMQVTARLLGEHLQASRCAYATVEDDQDHFHLFGDHNRGVASIVGRYAFTEFGAVVQRLMREDRPYVNPTSRPTR